MKTKYFLALCLVGSALYSYLTYTPRPSALPSVRVVKTWDVKEGKAAPRKQPPLAPALPTPVQGKGEGKASKSKATPALPPALPHKDTLAGRMERADKITIRMSTGIPYTTTVQGSTATPVKATPVHYTPTPRLSHLDRGSVTGSRRILPVFSVRKNGAIRYNGKTVR